jgi:hypothetical protein
MASLGFMATECGSPAPMGEIPGEQRWNLRDLLALEGPDFVSQTQATLREGLIAQSSLYSIRRGYLHIKLKKETRDEARDMLDRLSNVLDAVSQASADEVALLTHLCVDKSVDREALQILESVTQMANPLVSLRVLQIHVEHSGPITLEAGDAVQLLLTLNDPRAQVLRGILAPHLTNCISKRIEHCKPLSAGNHRAVGLGMGRKCCCKLLANYCSILHG